MANQDEDERARQCPHHRWEVVEPGDTCPACEDERTDRGEAP